MAKITRDNLRSVISEEGKKAEEYWQKAGKQYPKHKALYDFYTKADKVVIKYCNTFRADCDGMTADQVWQLAVEEINDLTAEFTQEGLYEEYGEEWQDGINFSYKVLQKERKRAEEGVQAFTARDIRNGGYDN